MPFSKHNTHSLLCWAQPPQVHARLADCSSFCGEHHPETLQKEELMDYHCSQASVGHAA